MGRSARTEAGIVSEEAGSEGHTDMGSGSRGEEGRTDDWEPKLGIKGEGYINLSGPEEDEVRREMI